MTKIIRINFAEYFVIFGNLILIKGNHPLRKFTNNFINLLKLIFSAHPHMASPISSNQFFINDLFISLSLTISLCPSFSFFMGIINEIPWIHFSFFTYNLIYYRFLFFCFPYIMTFRIFKNYIISSGATILIINLRNNRAEHPRFKIIRKTGAIKICIKSYLNIIQNLLKLQITDRPFICSTFINYIFCHINCSFFHFWPPFLFTLFTVF